MKKIEALRACMKAEDWRGAIRIAAKFPRLGDEKEAITRAHLAYTHPRFLLQINKDPAACIETGKAALIARYDSSS